MPTLRRWAGCFACDLSSTLPIRLVSSALMPVQSLVLLFESDSIAFSRTGCMPGYLL